MRARGCVHISYPRLERPYSHRPTGVSLFSIFTLCRRDKPVKRPVIAVNMEMQYSHQDRSAHLMDNFCRLSHPPCPTPPLIFVGYFPHLTRPRRPDGKAIANTKFRNTTCLFFFLHQQDPFQDKRVILNFLPI